MSILTSNEIEEHYKRCKSAILKYAKEGAAFRALVKGHNGWWDQDKLLGTARLYYPDERTYDRLIKNFDKKSLYWTAQLFTPDTAYESQPFDFETGKISKQIGSRENTIYHSFFLDLDRAKDKKIEDPKVLMWLEKGLKFFANKLLNAEITSFGLAFSGGGCYLYIHPKIGAIPLLEDETIEEHEYSVEVIQRAFDFFIGDIEDKFFEKYPEAKNFIKADKLNYDKKRQLKTILSIHKKLPFAVIPLDKTDPKIDLNKARLPLTDDVIKSAENWLTYDDNDFNRFGALLQPWFKKAEDTINKHKGKRNVILEIEQVKSSEWAPCMKNLIESEKLKSGGGATRALAVLASYLRFMGVSEDKAHIIFNKKAEQWNAETSNIFENWYAVGETNPKCFVPSCEKLNTKGSGYPHPELGELGICKPDERCKYTKSPIYYHKEINQNLMPSDFYITTNEKTGTTKVITKLFATDLTKIYHFKTLSDTEEILYYKDGCYHYHAEAIIRSEAEKLLGDIVNSYTVTEIVNHVCRSTYIKREELNNTGNILNLRNGLFDMKTFSFKEHTPLFLSIIQMPIVYNQDAECVKLEKFISEIVYPKDVPLIKEIMSYTLLNGYPYQNWFLFHGPGSNGKSLLLAFMREFLGSQNVASVPLQQLNQRFAGVRLYSKSANIVADLSDADLIRTDGLKALTGGDLITAEQKFKNPFEFVNTAKLIYSCNKVPVSNDKTRAFYRRVIYIPFPNTFEGKNADVNLLSKLTTEEEISGFFNIAIQALNELKNNGGFSYLGTPEENEELYERASNPVYGFVTDCCRTGPELYITKPELFDKYLDYCKENRVVSVSEKKFISQLRMLVAVVDARMQINGYRNRVWKGIEVTGGVDTDNTLEDQIGVELLNVGGESKSLEQQIRDTLNEFAKQDERGALKEALISRVSKSVLERESVVEREVDAMINNGDIVVVRLAHGEFLLEV